MSTLSSNISTTTTNFDKGAEGPGDMVVYYSFHPNRLFWALPFLFRPAWKKNRLPLGQLKIIFQI